MRAAPELMLSDAHDPPVLPSPTAAEDVSGPYLLANPLGGVVAAASSAGDAAGAVVSAGAAETNAAAVVVVGSQSKWAWVLNTKVPNVLLLLLLLLLLLQLALLLL